MYLYVHSVHQLARELLSELPVSEKNTFITTLSGKYYSLINAGTSSHTGVLRRLFRSIVDGISGRRRKKVEPKESDALIAQRGNICYFWGRLEAETGGSLLKNLYREISSGKIKEHTMNIGTIGTGILLTNDPEVEKLYLASIANGGQDDIRNRTYHRVYYGDAAYENPDTFLTDPHTFGVDDWPKTRQAILSRLKSEDPRSQALRGLDLVTFRRFCETRGIPTLESPQLQILRSSVNKLNHLPEQKIRIIVEEHNKLMKLFDV